MIKQKYEILEIWKFSIEIAEQICKIARQLEILQTKRFSEYVKDLCLRISNTIAEISDHSPREDVIRLLTTTHLLTLEAENITMILSEQQLVESTEKESLLKKIQKLDERILEFQQQSEGKYLLNNN